MSVLVWWPIVEHITNFIKTYKDDNNVLVFDGVDVYAGSKNKAKNFPCIEVTFDQESGIDIYRSVKGDIGIWIDIGVLNSGDDPVEAYREIYPYQKNVLNSLHDWIEKINQDLKIAIKINNVEVVSDGDIQRPTVMSRLILNLNWRNVI